MTTILHTCRYGLKRSTTKYLLLNTRCLSTQTTNNARLAEVGKFSVPKDDGIYETGQLFLHRVFGYRGIILFPWRAKVYDRNTYMPSHTKESVNDLDSGEAVNPSSPSSPSSSPASSSPAPRDESTDAAAQVNKLNSFKAELRSNTGSEGDEPTVTDLFDGFKIDLSSGAENTDEEISVKIKTYYQVLIDARDCPHVRTQTEAVTFLSSKESNRNLYAISGLDYVAQEDILPYVTSTRERKPLRHELFDKFLVYTGNAEIPFKPTETLYTWQEKNHPWLELAEVHRQITQNIRVTAIPFYMGFRYSPKNPVHWWRYSIRLENLGETSVQLRERHWRIFTLSGTLEAVRGRGVVGQEPVLNSRSPAFQYSSHISLQAPSGHMWGTFLMERQDGQTFDCRIPSFSLESFSNNENGQYVE